jgi:hypothetical protein
MPGRFLCIFITIGSRDFLEMGIVEFRFVVRQFAIGLVVMLNSSANAVIAAPEYFGYYYGDSEAYGHYMDKVVIPSDGTRLQDFTNLILIDIGTSYGQHNPRRAIIDAANLGYRVLLYGASGFEKDTPGAWQSAATRASSMPWIWSTSPMAADGAGARLNHWFRKPRRIFMAACRSQ